jgi:hypothetical protein
MVILSATLCLGVSSASNRYEYQKLENNVSAEYSLASEYG